MQVVCGSEHTIVLNGKILVIVIPRSPGIYRGKPPDPEGAARGRGVVFRDKSMVTMV